MYYADDRITVITYSPPPAPTGTTRRHTMQTMTEKLAAFAAATHNELFDAEYNGGEWMTEAVETRETIEDFLEASKSYNECTREKFGEVAGMKFVAFSKVQTCKGDQRTALSVIDFGDLRIAIDVDLTDFKYLGHRNTPLTGESP